MLNLLGEHICRIDAKGRLMFPAKLRRQLDKVLHHGLVINRDIFEGCLVLYPKPEWDKVNTEMTQLSRYNRKHQFVVCRLELSEYSHTGYLSQSFRSMLLALTLRSFRLPLLSCYRVTSHCIVYLNFKN